MENNSNELTGNDPIVKEELGATPLPKFSVSRSELAQFIQADLSPDNRIVFSFGLDENREMLLFVDIKDKTGAIIKASKMIERGNRSLMNPVAESVRKKNYINSLGGLPGRRDGISHVVISQHIKGEFELGFNEFIMKYPGNLIHIYMGEGTVSGEDAGSIYRKLYFSFNDKIANTEDEILYNKGGLCCPPAT